MSSPPPLAAPPPDGPFSRFTLGPVRLRNRVIKAATFEGMTPGGLPSPALTEHHVALARGGVGMTTVAYCAVEEDGRTFQDQLWLRPEVVPALRALTDAVHREGAAVSLQLGHCGAFTKNTALRRRRPAGPSAGFNAYGLFSGLGRAEALSAAEIEALPATFAAAAGRAVEAGFDAVELHLGHGYLLSQFLCPAANRRRDAWGGSAEHRRRLPLAVVRAVLDRVGARAAVLCKTNLRDGFPGGLELPESVELARALEREGAHALVLSGGYVSRDAFYLFRGERPLRDMIAVEKSGAQRLALRLFGPFVIREHPFEPLYFLPLAREVRAAVRMPLCLLGGLKQPEDLERARREGFELMQLGRALLHTPGLIGGYAAGTATRSGCEPCNRCVAEMDRPGGVACARQPEQLAARARRVEAAPA